MVKIKREVKKNLPQLIEWGFENNITGTMFSDGRVDAKRIRFEVGSVVSMYGYMHKSDTFTVEVEEEITEDTVFENLIEILDGSSNCLWERASVKDWKDEDSKEFHAYINGEFKCIWRNGKLVE